MIASQSFQTHRLLSTLEDGTLLNRGDGNFHFTLCWWVAYWHPQHCIITQCVRLRGRESTVFLTYLGCLAFAFKLTAIYTRNTGIRWPMITLFATLRPAAKIRDFSVKLAKHNSQSVA